MKYKIEHGKYTYIIFNERGEEVLITKKQYQSLLDLKEKLEKLNPYNIEQYINKQNISIPIKVVVFISYLEKRIVLLYRENSNTLVDIIREF